MIIPASTPGQFPQMEFAELPYMFPSAGVAAATYWDIAEKYAADKDFKDVVVLGAVAIAPAQYVGNVAIANVEDFAGKRIRNDGVMEAKVIKALGATPVEIETAELVPSLERGMADGAFLTWSAVFAFGVADITKDRTKADIFYRVWPIVINKDVWDSMGSEIQNEIMSVSGQPASVHYSEKNEEDAFGTMKGLEGQGKAKGKPDIVMLTPEQKAAWQAKLMPLWDEWAQSLPTGADIIADIKAMNEQYKGSFGSTTTTMGSTETTAPPEEH
jgi:TRAP-type C4-dicarboxylate transport system substrate-binding protein